MAMDWNFPVGECGEVGRARIMTIARNLENLDVEIEVTTHAANPFYCQTHLVSLSSGEETPAFRRGRMSSVSPASKSEVGLFFLKNILDVNLN